MAVTKIKPIKSTLSKALDYIQNPDKTDGKMLVSSFGCSYETADIEFGFTLAQAIEKGNNLAHHLIQSFEPGEVDYEKAHEIGKQLADAVTKGQHEYVLTTHIDKGHIHNHIIFCAVNFVDYHKYNSNKRSYYGIRNMSDRLCRENGLSVVVPGKGSKGKSYAEYHAEKVGTSWKGKLKITVDTLITQVASFEELLQRLQAAGYEIKPGKYISCRAPGQERFYVGAGSDFQIQVKAPENGVQEKQPEQKPSRPELKLLGHDGNIFSILGDAARLLRRAGMSEQANEMADRVHKSSNYYEALGIISEYVETELSDHREQPRTPRKETLKKEDTCR